MSYDLQKPVWFQNDGEIDPLVVTTMGVNIKPKDSSIGHFGTGLKFAIATILRAGGRIEIFSGLKPINIRTEDVEIRGEPFSLVVVNEQATGYTTKLGRNWQMWMAYREIHSNGLDEPNFQVSHSESPAPESGKTLIKVYSDEFQSEYYKRGRTFLSSDPITSTRSVEIHSGGGKEIYYRGVIVGVLETPSLHTFNFLQSIELTEDRTIKNIGVARGIAEDAISRNIDNQDIIEKTITAPKENWEHGFIYTEIFNSSEFTSCLRSLLERPDIDKNELGYSVKGHVDRIQRSLIGEAHEIELNSENQADLDFAIQTIRDMGLPLKEFPIVPVETLGRGVMGQAKDGKAFLARGAFQNGRKYLTVTLLEEWLHLTTGFTDYSRAFQDWCINELVSLHGRKNDIEILTAPPATIETPTDEEIPF